MDGKIPLMSVALGAAATATAYEAARSLETPNPTPAARLNPEPTPGKSTASKPSKAAAAVEKKETEKKEPEKKEPEKKEEPKAPVAKSDADLFYAQLLTQRRIFLNGRVDDKSAHTLVGKMLFLDAADPTKPIVMYINSGGGVVTSGLAIYDVMQHVRPPVYTVCLGHAESMAAVLLCAGEKGHRYALPNSRIMIHQPHHVVSGQTTDIIIKAKKAEHTRETLSAIIQAHSGKGEGEVNAALERDTYMTASEAKKFGIVDHTVTRITEIEGLDLDKGNGKK